MFVTGGSNADGPISDVAVLDLGMRVRRKDTETTRTRTRICTQFDPNVVFGSIVFSHFSASLLRSILLFGDRAETFEWEEIPARALRKKTHAAVAAQSLSSSSSGAASLENASASASASAAVTVAEAAGAHSDEDEDPDAPSVPEPREMHSATVAPKGASIFVFGGRTAETVCDHFYEFVIGAFQCRGSINAMSRSFSILSSLQYVFTLPFANFYMFSGARAWRLHDRCEPLCGHATAMFGQRAVHVGGTDGRQLFDAVQVFNTGMLYTACVFRMSNNFHHRE